MHATHVKVQYFLFDALSEGWMECNGAKQFKSCSYFFFLLEWNNELSFLCVSKTLLQHVAMCIAVFTACIFAHTTLSVYIYYDLTAKRFLENCKWNAFTTLSALCVGARLCSKIVDVEKCCSFCTFRCMMGESDDLELFLGDFWKFLSLLREKVPLQ